jgi:hypothetical protein
MERLTLEEAIKHAKEVADMNYNDAEKFDSNDSVENYMKANCMECAEQHEKLAEWLEELKSYKEAEEQGLLVRLPVNKNKEIYIISSRWTVCSECGSRFDEYSCSGCEYECDSKKEYYVRSIYLSSINVSTYANQFGKTIFFTSEEAKKKLEELKNEI